MPFGDPDGAYAPLDDFVDCGASTGNAALQVEETDLRVRVFSGKKGTGKTLYLRRHEAAARTPAHYVVPIAMKPPPSSVVIDLGQRMDRSLVSSHWRTLWRRAVILSLTSHLLSSSTVLSEERMDWADVPTQLDVLFGADVALDPYAALNILASRARGPRLERFLTSGEWDILEVRVAEHLRTFRPVFFYLDGMDEEFESAPMYWMVAQYGLYLTVMDFLRDPRFHTRLHVVVCLRDLVLSSARRSEHKTRLAWDSHTRYLEWNVEAISFLLASKLRGLPGHLLCGPGDEPGVGHWLGATTIQNVARQCVEDLEGYILRHTRLIPRDLIHLGNRMTIEVRTARRRGVAQVSPEAIRRVVAECGREFGDEQLSICSHQVAADEIPNNITERAVEYYVGSAEYVWNVSRRLRVLLGTLPTDRLGQSALDELRKQSSGIFPTVDPEAILAVLWQNGLLGYAEHDDIGRERHTFFGVDGDPSFTLPPGHDEYVLHPCLLDALGTISSVGSMPIRAGVWQEKGHHR
jgi:hypothetical protein